jgi:eukaryotic-like serine/threonine-protein kinase
MKTLRECPACGKPLPADAPAGLCPECLLQSASATLVTDPTAAPRPLPRPVPGRLFGGYRILRLLGRGGMGEVYEADHEESGRRVALKVMNHTLGSDTDRKRFLREGRLAASVSHPHVIYVYGSEEVEGVPVIAMELVHEGTLKDLVKKRGPLPVAEAVDHVLQVIAGLDAAGRAGVLHRDIKPTNCFVSADGTVKVGDFGLSISTLARGESLVTATGSVMGTPGMASPEQLRGEELDARSDIYSVGATLYYLVTGKLPFQADDLVKLIATVLDKPADSPAKERPDLPPAFCQIVLRCLAKDRKARFASYEELTAALLPFSGTAPKAANPGIRFVAGLIDDLIAGFPEIAGFVLFNATPDDQFLANRTATAALICLAGMAWRYLYFGWFEGLRGAGLGKGICGLRVHGPDGNAPGFGRAFARAVTFDLTSLIPFVLAVFLFTAARYGEALASGEFILTDWLYFPLFALLWVTMRRANGFAGLHDLATGTRVVVTPRRESRPPVETAEPAAPSLTSVERIGPYLIRGELASWDGHTLFLGHDETLRRDVWIHRQPAGAEAVATRRRELSRPTRLRWLNGRREGEEAWDAYEAPDGHALSDLLATPQPWSAVRFWLHDLATEFHQGQETGSPVPVFRLDRIWVRKDGQAMVLDFPGPRGSARAGGRSESVEAKDTGTLQALLHDIATQAVERPGTKGKNAPPPPPVSAREFIGRLAGRVFESTEILLGNLESLIHRPAVVSARMRLSALIGPVAFVIFLGALMALTIHNIENDWDEEWNRLFPGRTNLRHVMLVESQTLDDQSVTQLHLFVGAEFGDLLTNAAFWSNPTLGMRLNEDERSFLTNCVVIARAASEERRQHAVSYTSRILDIRKFRNIELRIAIFLLDGCVTLMAMTSLVLTILLGQPPLLRMLGLRVVDQRGRLAARGRLAWRWMVSWGPPILLLGMVTLFILLGGLDSARNLRLLIHLSLVCLLMATAFLDALGRRPWRGWHDRLAGTFVVPQ